MTAQNLEYYLQRAEEELAAARQASDPAIAKIHLDLAGRYRDLLNEQPAWTGEGSERQSGAAAAEPAVAFG